MRIAVRSIYLGSSSLPVSAGWSRRPWLGCLYCPAFNRIMWGKVAANDISIFEGRAVEQYSTGGGIYGDRALLYYDWSPQDRTTGHEDRVGWYSLLQHCSSRICRSYMPQVPQPVLQHEEQQRAFRCGYREGSQVKPAAGPAGAAPAPAGPKFRPDFAGPNIVG